MSIIVYGASGPTGLQVVQQAMDRDLAVTAVTRHPERFPIQASGVRVVGADLLDPDAVGPTLEGATAVISTLGVPYSLKPITTYSRSLRHVVDAMEASGPRRLVCVSSKEVAPQRAPGEPLEFRLLVDPLLRRVGATLYADMARMEKIVRASSLDWTIVRPSALFDGERVTGYRVTEDHVAGVFTSRVDLADALLSEVSGESPHPRATIEVQTTEGTPNFLRLAFSEALGR